MNICTRTYSIG